MCWEKIKKCKGIIERFNIIDNNLLVINVYRMPVGSGLASHHIQNRRAISCQIKTIQSHIFSSNLTPLFFIIKKQTNLKKKMKFQLWLAAILYKFFFCKTLQLRIRKTNTSTKYFCFYYFLSPWSISKKNAARYRL